MNIRSCQFGVPVLPPFSRKRLKPFAMRDEKSLGDAMEAQARSDGQHMTFERFGPAQGGAHLRPEGAESVALRARIMDLMAGRRMRFHTIMSETGATERRARDALNRLIKSGDVGAVKSGDKGFNTYHLVRDASQEATGEATTGHADVSQGEMPDQTEWRSAARSCAVVVIEKAVTDAHNLGHPQRFMRISLAAAPWEIA